ncbi:MAG: hypothetical protein AAGA60_18985 [Cyanobacteria bacterium P01_E01_bin.42]
MSNHSNKKIKEHIDNSKELLKNLHDLTHLMGEDVFQAFKDNFGVPIPDVVHSKIRVVQYDLVSSSDPIFKEYKDGATKILQSLREEGWETLANEALDVVTSLLNGILSSQKIKLGLSAGSEKTTEKNKKESGKEKTFITACLANVNRMQAKDWGTQKDFYIAYYVFVIWSPRES